VPRFSIITTCKGRLHHLKQSLPRFLAQRDSEVIVVDYDCPDGTADYVKRMHPAAKVVQITDAPVFNIAHARNLGAEGAVADWLVFLDADVLVAPDLSERIAAILEPGPHYYRFNSSALGLLGSCVVRRADFRAVQGYDQVIDGYGGEDNEFYGRLERFKIARGSIDGAAIEASLEHGPEERVQFFKRKSILGSVRINAAYRVVKHGLLQQLGVPELPEEMRRSLYAHVRRAAKVALMARKSRLRIAVPLPDDHGHMLYWEWEAKRRLVFDLNLKQTATEAEVRSGRAQQRFLEQ
jgi:glycosyltransferase involved in cell wall biosynthesis